VKRETVEVDVTKLDESSRRVLAAFANHPRRHSAKILMEHLPDGTWSLVCEIPSPTNDRRRAMSIWLDEKRVPSLEFGAWHTPGPSLNLSNSLLDNCPGDTTSCS
jgi:hypothetical protein